DRMDDGSEGRNWAVNERNRGDRQRDPAGGDLAVVSMPDFREQQRPGSNGKQDTDEGQAPRPSHRLTRESDSRMRRLRRKTHGRSQHSKCVSWPHRVGKFGWSVGSALTPWAWV